MFTSCFPALCTMHSYRRDNPAFLLRKNVRYPLAIYGVKSDECTTKTEGGTHMEIRYNVTGARRKELVKIISDITGARAEYQYMPTCNYKIAYFTVTRDGTLCFDDYTDRAENERVLEAVAAAGFECELQDLVEAPAEGEMEASERDTKGNAETVKADSIMEDMGIADTEDFPDTVQQSRTSGLTVEIPLDKVAVGNLTRLLDAKGNLIKKALGVDALPIKILEDRASFPWF